MGCLATVVWDDGYLAYDFGDHPLNPRRLEFTISLARELGVLDNVTVLAPVTATDTELRTVHDESYLQAVRVAGADAVEVTVPADGRETGELRVSAPSETVPELARALVAADVDITGLHAVERSLEEVFFDLTRTEAPVEVPA